MSEWQVGWGAMICWALTDCPISLWCSWNEKGKHHLFCVLLFIYTWLGYQCLVCSEKHFHENNSCNLCTPLKGALHVLLGRTSWWPAQHLPHLQWKARKEHWFSSTILLLMLSWSCRKNFGYFWKILFFLSCQYYKVRDTQTRKGPRRSYSLA